jgi:hypothetical protein
MSSSSRPGSLPSDTAAPKSVPARRPRSLKARTHVWMRWLHTYTSMISLLVVLFFSLTGITLNHPDWAFGTLPTGWIEGTEVNWLTVAEELRAQQGVHGRAGDTRLDGTEASLSFKAPGYSADAFIDTATGKYTLNVQAQGGVAVLNDLHRGRDAGPAWAWLIDLSGVFLTVVSLTGLGILLYLKKSRVKALAAMLGAGVLVVVLARLALS